MVSKRYDLVVAREYEANGETKTAWTRIGVMFERDKGGYSLSFDGLPVTGKCFAFPPQDKDRSDRGGRRDTAPAGGADPGFGDDDIPF